MQKFFVLSRVLVFSLLLGACAPPDSPRDKIQPEPQTLTADLRVIGTVVDEIGCDDLREVLFENLQLYLMDAARIPAVPEIRRVVAFEINRRFAGQISSHSVDELLAAVSDFYQMLINEVPQRMQTKQAWSLKRTLGALKVGDRSTEEANQLQKLIEKKLFRIQQIVSRENIRCAGVKLQSRFNLSDLQIQALRAKVPLILLGGRKSLATAYQSCDSLRIKPLNRSVPHLEGVEVIGTAPYGGKIRKIVDQAAVARTHPYIKDFVPTAGCLDVKKITMIYDFGGKPYATTDANSTLNFWRDAPGGGPGLGIDCSGFVFSAVAAGGLRLREGKPLKAFEVQDYPAMMYMDPQNNGFTCLEKVSMGAGTDLKAGDLVVAPDHIVIVDKVGRDPLAIRKYSDCDKITYQDFDFVIAQSSPEQNAVGINRYSISEYLAQQPSNSSIFAGFREYAVAACKAYRGGRDVLISSENISVVRHKMTPSCLQPEIKLDGQSCIQSCREILDRTSDE